MAALDAVLRLLGTIKMRLRRAMSRNEGTNQGAVERMSVKQYLNSGDFNGLPVRALKGDDATLREMIIQLIADRRIDLVRGDYHPNPHIKAFAMESVEEQIRKIKEEGLGYGCLYPTPELLASVDLGKDLGQEPYTLELSRGAPQLDFRTFDLRVLEWYRNDPRYAYEVDDIHGQITIKDEYRHDRQANPKDTLELFRFGFAYDDDMVRAVAVYLRDLQGLNPEHQTLLKGYELHGTFKLHPDFYRNTILGQWSERVSIYDAFLAEKSHINKMCRLMGKPPLFRTEYRDHKRPQGFGIMLRPTKKELRDFTMLLDQLLSDDIDRAFFEGDIPTTEILTREDGSKTKQPIGTITLLERWFTKRYRSAEPDVPAELIKDIRKVRNARQKPAHKLEDNEFEQKFLADQRELIETAFNAARTIRMALENHPKVVGYDIPDYLRNGKVWSV
ncbi:hypothetical protein NKH95_28290 [Mesorhizobium sp. M0848]|uniref:hypothetical protein n=1 Tax=Mesorhizobium sp. M0848 TaxID=2957012 RepID=UPI00333C4F69